MGSRQQHLNLYNHDYGVVEKFGDLLKSLIPEFYHVATLSIHEICFGWPVHDSDNRHDGRSRLTTCRKNNSTIIRPTILARLSYNARKIIYAYLLLTNKFFPYLKS